MAAEFVLPQPSKSYNSVAPRSGVITLYGYGIRVNVNRSHLVLEGGIASDRRGFRLSRVGHGLKRLVIIGSDGFISLSAVRWLASQDIALSIMERDGSMLAMTAPVCPSDARLRRSQALAHQSGAAFHITRELIARKLAGQERVARYKLLDGKTADAIAEFRARVASAANIGEILQLESQGAAAYWEAWRNLPVMFPKQDLSNIPAHWASFGTRKSAITGSQRLATNPPNAMLNYLYAVLESETCLAITALGLDSGCGLWHMDTPNRNSLACDVMEVIRPQVDAYLLDWITREPLKRSWFFEKEDGNCRLMTALAVELSQTAPMWARAVAPFAEWVATTLWLSISKSTYSSAPPTRLTQRNKREARGKPPLPPSVPAPRRKNLCRSCGKTIRSESTNCPDCALESRTHRFGDVARIGRELAHTPDARVREGQKQHRHAEARAEWTPANQPAWLTADVFREKIQPRLAKLSNAVIASRIGVSRWYAWRIRKGYTPHPKHWQALADLARLAPGCQGEL